MAYLSFMSDDHLLACIKTLYEKYNACKQGLLLRDFYKNKVDPIKFYFDMKFNDIDLEDYINAEITRKNDKSISNAIGDFHQSLIDGIDGFEAPQRMGYDVRKLDDTIFGELKNKHNTMNSSSAAETFNKLELIAEEYPNATCYLIEIIATRSQDLLWARSGVSHPRVRKISADKFYALATGNENAFKELCYAIPVATNDYLTTNGITIQQSADNSAVYSKLISESTKNKVDILTQIFNDTFSTYNGF